MTEYGRGQGSQPWHPEDPLYGDQGWDGTQRQAGQEHYGDQLHGHSHANQPDVGEWQQSGGYQASYDQQQYGQGQGQYQHDPYGQDPLTQQGSYGQQDPYGQQGQYGHQDPYGQQSHAQQDPYAQQNQHGHQDPYGHGQYESNGQQHPYHQQDPYGHGGQYDTGQYSAGSYDTGQYDTGQFGTGSHDTGQYDTGQYDTGQFGTGSHDTGQFGTGSYDTGQYDTGRHETAQAYPTATDPYAEQAGYQGYPGQPDPYATEEAYPPPRPQQHRQSEPDPDGVWDPGPELEDHAFFADDAKTTTDADKDGPDEGDEDGARGTAPSGRTGGRGRKGTARRKNSMACLVIAVVFVGGVGGAGYFGYQYYQSRFSSAPDFEGQGSGEVQVEIPANSSLSDIGNILKREGVVKSHDAFVAASGKNDKAGEIHAGSYILRKEMSSSAAIELMLNPASQGGLIIPEGLRATRIYELIDKQTESSKGTTEKVAEKADLGLPSWADGEAEGFLFPSKYSVSKNTDPEDVLKEMVKRAKAEFKKVDLEGSAKKVNHSPLEVLTIASLIQAEAQSDDEYGKVSQVVYNRLKPGNSATNGKLDFDSTINYALGRSTLDVSVTDTKLDHPYNTYRHAGLPPGPIDNPGHQAIEAALKPTKGDWLYFVTVRPGDTRFSASFEEHTKHVREFNEEQRKNRGGGD